MPPVHRTYPDPPVSPSTGASDTPPDIRRRMIEGYRRMSPTEKLRRVLDLNWAVETLALARIRKQYGPDLSEREDGSA